MRFVYIALIATFVAIIMLFKVQNLETVTVGLLGLSATMPVSVLVGLIYILGALTGGTLMALMRTWFEGAKRRL
jgi:putative membrane protein